MGIGAGIQALGAIGGAIEGRRSAKEARAGMDQERADIMRSYLFSEPYIERSYDRAEDALNKSLETGTYQGPSYARMNPYEQMGYDFMGNMGLAMGNQGFGIANTGANFAKNYADLYNQGQQDRMATAQQYAINNAQPLVDAAMRDDRRNLTENTLPGINRGASASGNMNSSRAGIADAIAQRGYADREADVTANIQNSLMDRSLTQQQQQFANMMGANRGLQGAYTTGLGTIGTAGNFMTGAGRGFRDYEQGALDDARRRFAADRDFALDQNIKYQQGILNRADYESPQMQTYRERPNTNMSTIGGLMSGFGMGSKIGGFF